MHYLIIGLGNIGPEYTFTRHNIGFQVLDHLAAQQAIAFQPERLAFFTSFKYRGKSIGLIKPTTYMNLTGKAVHYWCNKLKIPIHNILVVVDDLALPFGKLRIRKQGSDAGHNGLKSVAQWLHSQAYPRLKFGIGNNFAPGQQANYVLAPFNSAEMAALPAPMNLSCEIIYSFCTLGIMQTMNRYNN